LGRRIKYSFCLYFWEIILWASYVSCFERSANKCRDFVWPARWSWTELHCERKPFLVICIVNSIKPQFSVENHYYISNTDHWGYTPVCVCEMIPFCVFNSVNGHSLNLLNISNEVKLLVSFWWKIDLMKAYLFSTTR